MAGLFLAILNQTLLNVAMPHLMTEFGVSATTIQWLTTGYMLVNGVLIPLSAFLITRFGQRSLFLVAMFCFTAGTLVCGIAPNFSTMLIGRLIQAVGGGILRPLVMTTILLIFPPESRGKEWDFRSCDDVCSGGRTDSFRLDHRALHMAHYVLRPCSDRGNRYNHSVLPL